MCGWLSSETSSLLLRLNLPELPKCFKAWAVQAKGASCSFATHRISSFSSWAVLSTVQTVAKHACKLVVTQHRHRGRGWCRVGDGSGGSKRGFNNLEKYTIIVL